MEAFNNSILDVIGNTPIVRLNSVANEVDSDIYVKLEYLNPGGSIKDKIGLHMCKKALERGDIKPGGTIIEGTSGNTGVGIAMFCALHDLKAVFVMADKQSQEKIDCLKSYGATVIVCPTDVKPEDPRSYYSVSAMLPEIIPNSLYLNQYANLDNSESHYLMTGPEIFEQTKGEFDVFMTAVGTGGTISGTGKYLKEKMPNVKVVGIDCVGSIIDEYHRTGKMGKPHNYVLEGIGEDFIPGNINFDVIDEFVVVGDEESFHMTRDLLTKEGIYTGGSAGAAIVGAIRYAKKLETPKKILVILHDSGNRYSSKIFNDSWMIDMGYLPKDHSNPEEKRIYTALKDAGVEL
ncbi:cysteine synthase family protein [Bacteriovoracaceae bacterium]|nr:cysteine synthase family protein [Bacteriovoracaceae bacterium]